MGISPGGRRQRHLPAAGAKEPFNLASGCRCLPVNCRLVIGWPQGRFSAIISLSDLFDVVVVVVVVGGVVVNLCGVMGNG